MIVELQAQPGKRSEHAFEYRRQQGLSVERPQIAVLVQQWVAAEVAAVVFSANPITGSRDEVMINASWGLGESIVGGTVTPDTFIVRKSDVAVVQRIIADKQRMTVSAPGGTHEADVPCFLRSTSSLNDEQVIEMARTPQPHPSAGEFLSPPVRGEKKRPASLVNHNVITSVLFGSIYIYSFASATLPQQSPCLVLLADIPLTH